MKNILTDAAIRYTWGQIFYRMGISPGLSKFSIAEKKIIFQYGVTTEKELLQNQFKLSVLRCEEDASNRLINDPTLNLTWLNKKDFLPNITQEFPIEKLPVLIWGRPSSKAKFAEIENGNHLIINIDIIASIFFMLSRIEEYSSRIPEKHGRFPYLASAAYRHKFLGLPVVDLYTRVLRYWLEELTHVQFPNPHQFKVSLSHDIDNISLFRPVVKGGIDLVKNAVKFNFGLIKEDIGIFFNSYKLDPYFAGINFLSDQSAKFGFFSTFFIMAAKLSLKDSGYSLSSHPAHEMTRAITANGHAIGLHASYRSFGKSDLLLKEKAALEILTRKPVDIIRTHYLRISTPESWKTWQNAGFTKDTSYGTAEHEGFRCGTCFSFKPFDITTDHPLEIIEEPLIVMDTTLKGYRHLSIQEGRSTILRLAKLCKFVGGNFTLLWHNTSFFRDWKKWGDIYPEILSDLHSTISEAR
jgi:hypothetical protein